MPDEKLIKLFKRIVTCDHIKNGWIQPKHPCNKIISFQREQVAGLDIENFQIPEPWSGDIINAPILFVGPNPSYAQEEYYPNSSWCDRDKINFFSNRFSKYANENMGPKLTTDGEYGRPPHYWVRLRHIAADMFKRKLTEVTPGKDYALTEAVMCKSQRHIGVESIIRNAMRNPQNTCPAYFMELLPLSKAKVCVCFSNAVDALKHAISLAHDKPEIIFMEEPMDWERLKECGVRSSKFVFRWRSKIFAFLPHPSRNWCQDFLMAYLGKGGKKILTNELQKDDILL
jgi:hypothetical protein